MSLSKSKGKGVWDVKDLEESVDKILELSKEQGSQLRTILDALLGTIDGKQRGLIARVEALEATQGSITKWLWIALTGATVAVIGMLLKGHL